MNKLAVCVLGFPNSGKSETWYSLFGTKVKRGKDERDLLVFEGGSPLIKEYVKVFLINGSPQENGEFIKKMLPKHLPNIVLCSLQYVEGPDFVEGMFGSLDWLHKNGYFLFVLWLCPSYKNRYPYLDDLGLSQKIHRYHNCLLGRRDGNHNPEGRAEEIRAYIHGWAKSNGLTY